MNWSVEQVLGLAPDVSSAKRGQSLAHAKKWLLIEANDRAIWGECKGSGSRPYRTRIDLVGPAYKCSCPSRAFPCKHAIGLFLLRVSSNEVVIKPEPPIWVSDWLEQRDKKRKPKVKADLSPAEIKKRKADKAKRLAKRVSEMQEGFNDLENWIVDLIRQGIAALESRPYSFWKEMAAQMVDRKISGASGIILDMALIPGSGPDWPDRMVQKISSLYLLIRAFRQLDKLPDDFREEVVQVAGIKYKKEEVFEMETVEDVWQVLGVLESVQEDLNLRRTYLSGKNTGRMAMLLEFAHGNMAFEGHYFVGHSFEGALSYYPGVVPLRAIIKKRTADFNAIQKVDGFNTVKDFLAHYAKDAGKKPWLAHAPCILSKVIPQDQKGQFLLLDENGEGIPVQNRSFSGWKLLALSGGHPIQVFGEWTGQHFVPFTVMTNSQWINLSDS